jgi:hypothetical protein
MARRCPAVQTTFFGVWRGDEPENPASVGVARGVRPLSGMQDSLHRQPGKILLEPWGFFIRSSGR